MNPEPHGDTSHGDTSHGPGPGTTGNSLSKSQQKNNGGSRASTVKKFGLGFGAGLLLSSLLSPNSNNAVAKRTSEAFEGRVNAELVGRALGDHGLDE
jgi:hypothetical protein